MADKIKRIYLGDKMLPRIYQSNVVGSVYSGDFEPTDITGLLLWLDASDDATVSHAGGTVSSWADKSGKGHDATQSTVLNQPDYVASGLNGKPVLRFDGTNHFIDGTMLPALGTDPFTFFIVGQSADTATNKYLSIIGQVGAGIGLFFTPERAIRTGNGNRIWGSPFVDASVGSYVDASVGSYVAEGNSHVQMLAWDNGEPLSPITTANNATAYTITSGAYGFGAAFVGSNHLACDIAEAVFYPRVLTTVERQKIEGYLAWKWGLQEQLPYDHPYASSFPG